MATMYEIYDKHAFEYDELVSREDYKENLPAKLNELFDFAGKNVIEFGTGTGRLTALYCGKAQSVRCFDRSSHMLDKAKENLKRFGEKISFDQLDNNEIGSLEVKGDYVIEGWSFGHTVSDFAGKELEKAEELIGNSLGCLMPGGTAIIVETLGTDTEEPGAPSDALAVFYGTLENKFGFTRVVVPTDYRFDSAEEAAAICGFFFGSDAGREILRKGSPLISEFTGLWYKTV